MRLLVLMLAVALAGCASVVTVDALVPPAVEVRQNQLSSMIELEPVAVGFPRRIARVDNETYEEALRISLAEAGFLADGVGRYRLNALPRSIQHEGGVFEFTAAAVVDYELVDGETGVVLFDETIATTGVSSDAFGGMQRAQYAGERAVASNIEELMRRLSALAF